MTFGRNIGNTLYSGDYNATAFSRTRLLIIIHDTLSSLKVHTKYNTCMFLLEIVDGFKRVSFNAEDVQSSNSLTGLHTLGVIVDTG